MRKTTEQLMDELHNCNDINEFIERNKTEMLNMSLSKYLRDMLIKYGVEKGAVFKRANMAENNYGYELFRNDTKKASRDKLIQICMGFPLTIEDAQNVLRYGEMRPLYPRNQRDAYILFALKKGYDMFQLNELLFEHGEKIIE